MHILKVIQAAAVSCSLATTSLVSFAAPTFINGGFEQPDIPNLYFGSVSTLPGWEALAGIELTGPTLWPVAEGDQAIELNGSNASIEQTVGDFVAGGSYTLSFSLAGNPDIDQVYGLMVDAFSGSSLVASQSYTFDSTGFSRSDLGWRTESMVFSATAPSVTFRFRRIDGGATGWGPELDGVSIAAVPEPASVGLTLCGLAALALARVRRRQT